MPRRSPRAVLLWLGAAVLAVATALVVATDLASLHRRAATLGPARTVAVAADDLPVGSVVRPSDLTSRSVHRSQLPDDALAPSEVRDRVVAVAVVRGAFVLEGNLAPRDRNGLDGAIPRGMRALRIVVRDSLRPQPGSAVDVLVTFDATTEATAEAGSGTAVAARGVLVLGTDDSPAILDAASASGTGGLGVTLLVTEDEAERVAYASAAGTVTLSLVPPEDAAPVLGE